MAGFDGEQSIFADEMFAVYGWNTCRMQLVALHS